jgi:hypothetical protein
MSGLFITGNTATYIPTISGTVDITVRSNVDSSSTFTLTLNVKQLNVGLTTDKTTMLVGEIATLSATTDYGSIVWSNTPGLTVNGLTATFIPTAGGLYTLTAMSSVDANAGASVSILVNIPVQTSIIGFVQSTNSNELYCYHIDPTSNNVVYFAGDTNLKLDTSQDPNSRASRILEYLDDYPNVATLPLGNINDTSHSVYSLHEHLNVSDYQSNVQYPLSTTLLAVYRTEFEGGGNHSDPIDQLNGIDVGQAYSTHIVGGYFYTQDGTNTQVWRSTFDTITTEQPVDCDVVIRTPVLNPGDPEEPVSGVVWLNGIVVKNCWLIAADANPTIQWVLKSVTSTDVIAVSSTSSKALEVLICPHV